MSDAWTMTVSRDEVRAIIQETLAEQNHLQSSDATIMKTIATILTSFGIEEEDRKEIRADFQHLRRWRKSVEQAQSYTFKTVIAVIVSGLLGAMWLGFKALAGK
jgi:ABC-type transporter Mla maintaining outer membrane lipid asymmetry permease subunit MlaE